MKKRAKKHETNIDDLAIMVGKGFEEIRGEFEESKSEFATFKTETKANFEKVEENFVKIRGQLNNMGDHFVTNHKFDTLSLRVLRVEEKVHKSSK